MRRILEEEGKKKTRKMSWVIREEKRNPEARIGLFPSLFSLLSCRWRKERDQANHQYIYMVLVRGGGGVLNGPVSIRIRTSS